MIIYNKIIPFKGYKSINLFELIFARSPLSDVDINHEKIHTAQMRELLYLGFYLIYLFEWLFLLIKNPKTAYRSISFEKEAYKNEKDMNYLSKRKHYAQWRS